MAGYEKQLFIGRVSNVTPQYNNIVFINGTISSGDDRITGITGQSGVQDPSLLRVGMTIQSFGGGYASNPTILSIDSATQITVDQNATSNVTNVFGASLPAGKYYFSSASFLDQQNLINVNDITGSLESDYDEALSPLYAIIGQASTTLGGTQINGRFFNYKITDVPYRSIGSAEISAFVEWAGEDTEADSGNALFTSANQTLAIGALSETASAVTIFDPSYITGTAVGSTVAGYQQTVVGVIDQALTESDGFPYTGSAQITGSLSVTGSSIISLDTEEHFLINNTTAVTQSLFKIDSEGIAIFRVQPDGFEPTPEPGHMYFTTESVFFGFEGT